jgi:6,7-dimethyl-8-ribityllumazine synthase
MVESINGNLNADGKKFAIIASRFNELITNQLLNGAVDCLVRHGAEEKSIKAIWVPGSFEIPTAAKRAALSKKYDAVICVGAVIRGTTPHFDYVAAEVSKGVAAVGLETNIPVIFGVITSDSLDQALERAGTKAGNKGWDAALAAIEMVDLFTKI